MKLLKIFNMSGIAQKHVFIKYTVHSVGWHSMESTLFNEFVN